MSAKKQKSLDKQLTSLWLSVYALYLVRAMVIGLLLMVLFGIVSSNIQTILTGLKGVY